MLKRVVISAAILYGVASTAATPAMAAEEFEGLIYPSEVVKVSSQVPGILEEVAVERGDQVRKGQVLARLKSGQEKASLEVVRANVEFLKRKTERNAELARKKLISVNENDELLTDLRKAELQLVEAEEKLKLRTILSTIDGVVTERLMAPGDYVGETPILKLASLNPLKVEVIVPAQRFGATRRGMKAIVRPEQPIGGVYTGRVTIVDKVIDAASSTFIVRVDFANPDLRVPFGAEVPGPFPEVSSIGSSLYMFPTSFRSIGMHASKKEQGQVASDSSCMDTVRANVFEVISFRGEIVLVFGNIQPSDADQDGQLSASLAVRMLLSPYTVKRLAILLNDKLRQYEATFGPLTREVPAQLPPELPAFRYAYPPYASVESAVKAGFLRQQVENLAVIHGMERSFKLSQRSLMTDRFIMSIKKDVLARHPEGMLFSIFQQMGMPSRFLDDCKGLLPEAAFIHFGFEERHGCSLYKAYLEFKPNVQPGSVGAGATQEPFLVFLGFKWDALDVSKCTVTRYTCYPLLSSDEILERLSCLFEGNQDYTSFETAKNILHDTVTLNFEHKIVYIEASEDLNPRKSFDMNFYGTKLRMRDIYPSLMDAFRHYSVPADHFLPFCDSIGDKTFGHLSGGIDREGKDFLSVYYGVEGRNAQGATRS